MSVKKDINAVDSKGRTSLHYASQKLLGVSSLLAAGADPNIQDNFGHTAMHLAAIEGFDRIVEVLLEYSANPNLLNCFQKQPIHYLAMKNHEEGIEAIAAAGGDLDTLDQDGFSPLYLAVKNNRPDAVKALLRANCCTEVGSCMPVKLALEKSYYAMAKLLILAGCDMNPVAEWVKQMTEKDNSHFSEDSFWPEISSTRDEDDSDDDADEYKQTIDWLKDWLNTPHSLQQLCRLTIRRRVGRRLHTPAQASSTAPILPLPKSLLDYVTLKEIDEHRVTGFGRWSHGYSRD